MTHVVYRVALVVTLAALTALLVVELPQGYAQEGTPPPPSFLSWVILNHKAKINSRIYKSQSLKVVR